MAKGLVIFGGTASGELSGALAARLNLIPGAASVQRLPDGEVSVTLEQSVRGRDVLIVQSTSGPVDSNLIELLAFADACRRSSAGHIAALVPYFGYARSDKRHGRREPIAASMVAMLLQAVGVQQLMTIDLHSAQIEGFFRIPVDVLAARDLICDAVRQRLPEGVVMVSPDAGRVREATKYAAKLRSAMAIVHKERLSATQTRAVRVVGDVRDHSILIIDDMIATGHTIIEAIAALRQAGCRDGIIIAATHGLQLNGVPALLDHPDVSGVYVTDTISQGQFRHSKLHVVSVVPLLAEAIRRIREEGSLGDMS